MFVVRIISGLVRLAAIALIVGGVVLSFSFLFGSNEVILFGRAFRSLQAGLAAIGCGAVLTLIGLLKDFSDVRRGP
jgi:hypothetical protein